VHPGPPPGRRRGPSPVPRSAARSRPEGAAQSRPEGAIRSRPEGAARSRPEGAARSLPESAIRSRPDGAGRSRPEGTIRSGWVRSCSDSGRVRFWPAPRSGFPRSVSGSGSGPEPGWGRRPFPAEAACASRPGRGPALTGIALRSWRGLGSRSDPGEERDRAPILAKSGDRAPILAKSGIALRSWRGWASALAESTVALAGLRPRPGWDEARPRPSGRCPRAGRELATAGCLAG
jgi:hypothetical protein